MIVITTEKNSLIKNRSKEIKKKNCNNVLDVYHRQLFVLNFDIINLNVFLF